MHNARTGDHNMQMIQPGVPVHPHTHLIKLENSCIRSNVKTNPKKIKLLLD